MIAFHFTGDTLRDGRAIPPIGEWLEHEGTITPCESGLHASADPFDALGYAPGATLHMVEIEGDLVEHGSPANKMVGRRRRIIASIDATPLLWDFARWCALQVIHLWDCPEVVRRYLETGDESIRAAARDAARDAAWAASWDAARAASWAAAWAASWDASWDAARAASWAASWAAAWAAARAAAWAAAWDAHRKMFGELVNAAFAKKERKQ